MCRLAALIAICAALVTGSTARAREIDVVSLRGHAQTLHVYGPRTGPPVIVSSGDGGWIHLAPHVAEALAARGFFVVGFDTRAYLSSFTSGSSTLRRQDVPADYKVLADLAAHGSTRRPILIGVSEGAGLSVLAATDARTRSSIDGVVALGLPGVNELAWRWKDALIYVTKGAPAEPSFPTAAVVGQMARTPLAAIHSTRDEFVPLDDVRKILAAAGEPKRLWVVTASDHRFSDNLDEFDRDLMEALAWVHEQAAS